MIEPCNGKGHVLPCEDRHCYVLNTPLFHASVIDAFIALRRANYTPDPTLMAQTICSRLRVNVSEEQVILNLPPQLAYRNNDAGEPIIFQYSP